MLAMRKYFYLCFHVVFINLVRVYIRALPKYTRGISCHAGNNKYISATLRIPLLFVSTVVNTDRRIVFE